MFQASIPSKAAQSAVRTRALAEMSRRLMGDFEMYASGKCHIRTHYNRCTCTFSFYLSLYKFHLWKKIGAQRKTSPEFYILFTIIDCVACVFLPKLHIHWSLGTRFRSRCLSQSTNIRFYFHTPQCLILIIIVGFLFSWPREVRTRSAVNAYAGVLLGSDRSPCGLHLPWWIDVAQLLACMKELRNYSV